ncbi:MAG: alpha-amylase family protein [Armatimonadota bacterium]
MNVRVAKKRGTPVLLIDGKPTAPCMFFINTEMPTWASRLPENLDDLRQMAARGIDLISIVIHMEWLKPGVTALESWAEDDLLRQIIEVHPKCKLLLRVLMTAPPDWWLTEHQQEYAVTQKGVRLLPSMFSEVWRRDASRSLEALVRHIESKFNANVLGYHPSGLNTGEWFCEGTWDGVLTGFEPGAQSVFQEWLRKKYRNDAGLRRASGDSSHSIDSVQVPTEPQRLSGVTVDFRDPKRDFIARAYAECETEYVAKAAISMCEAVKRAAPNKLTVIFYGYIYELCAAVRGYQSCGHAAMDLVLRSKAVDAVASPYSYVQRNAGGLGAYMVSVDSILAAGKLFFTEDDTRTHHLLSTPFAAEAEKSQRETNGVILRNFAHVLTHGHAIWWMDLMTEGAYRGRETQDLMKKCQDAYQAVLPKLEPYQPEIASITDDNSEFAITAMGELARFSMGSIRLGLYRVGAPLGYYRLADLLEGRLPSVKLLVMHNLHELNKTQRRKIDEYILRTGCSVVWIGAPGIISERGYDPNHTQAVTGMSSRETQPGASIIVTPDGKETEIAGRRIYPSLAINQQGAEVLGTHKDTGLPCLALRLKPDGSFVAWSTLTNIPLAQLKILIKLANVHQVVDSDDGVMAGNSYVAVHAWSAGEKLLSLPGPRRWVNAITGQDYGQISRLRVPMQKGDTILLRQTE